MELVIAGTHAQYRDYLRRFGKSPRETVYISSEQHLWGRRGDKIVRVGEWWLNPVAKSDFLRVLEREQITTD